MAAKMTECTVLTWDEICGEVRTYIEQKLNRGSNAEIIADLREKIYEEDRDGDDDESMSMGPEWEVAAITHTPKVTLVELKSSRGHLSTAQIIWS